MSKTENAHLAATTDRANRNRADPLRLDQAHHARSLTSLQPILHELSRLQRDRDYVYRAFVRTACDFTSSIWCGILAQDQRKALSIVASHSAIAGQSAKLAMSSIFPVCQRVAVAQKPEVYRQDPITVIAIPIVSADPNAANEVICLVASIGDAAPEPFMMLAQLVASHISQWQQRQHERQLHWKLESVAAVAELLAETSLAHDLQDAHRIVANRMRDFLMAETVAIGLCERPGSNKIQMRTFSGTDVADLGSPIVRKLTGLLAETLVRHKLTSAPDRAGEERILKLAHRQWCGDNESHAIVSAPLVTQAGETIGAWTCIFERDKVEIDRCTHVASVMSPFIADGLSSARKSHMGIRERLAKSVSTHCRARGKQLALATIAIFGCLLCIPIPHSIRCLATLEPAAQRFAPAPHEGLLRQAFVKTGDVVSTGELLARMDDAELHLRMAELEAQRQRAIKEQDVKRTSRDAGATQIAKLEIERIDLQIQLLQKRQQQSEIISPIDAVILESEVDEAEGMPVQTGQVLMRLAPIDHLKLHFSVPEQDIRHIESGLTATVSLDGYAMQPIEAKIDRVRPISEVSQQQNVFIAEAIIENQDSLLRPGMTGHAKIRIGKRAAGWVYFHHAVEKLFAILH